jgi:hypothetical protein
MGKMKMTLLALLGLLIAAGAGWLWGAWGRWAIEGQLREVKVQAQLADARASLWAARVDIFELNFGRASANIERAKTAMGAAAGQLEQAARGDATAAVREAVTKAGEAQQLTGSLDQTANARVADALQALARASAVPQK